MGLRIHQGRIGRPPILPLVRRTGTPGETEDELDQDTNHSVCSLKVPEAGEESSVDEETRPMRVDPVSPDSTEEERKRINWPKAAERIAWQRFEEEVECVLESTLAGTFV